ncbi:MAG: response regulator [Acidobacteria bacterium]|nr:response regulator [Acidobacteriota bacterium]
MTALRTVLVVDDDAESRRLAVRLLEEIGWRAVEASDGRAAVELAGRVPLDLVLLDLRLPGEVDGLRAASLMRQNPALYGVPIIAVSASPYKDFRHRAFAAGCTAFLSKPINLKELQHQVELLTFPRGGP